MLDYLVLHRDRVVAKDELLERLWEGTHVTEGSLQRAVSLARAALGERGHEMLRTFPKQGYRFVASEPATAEEIPRPRYADNGGVHLAYYTLGSAETGIDIVYVAGWAVPARSLLHHPKMRAHCEELTQLGRVILFDKRGTGQSDRPKVLPDLSCRMQDLVAILDSLGSDRAVLIGVSEAAPLSLLFAATHPARTLGLVLVGAFARMSRGPGYPHGWSREQIERLRGYIRRDWGLGSTILAAFGGKEPSQADREWSAIAEQQGASPGAALELLEMNLEADVRGILKDVSVPVELVHSASDAVMPVGASRFLASELPNAQYEELPGSDHAFFLAEPGFWLERVRRVLARRLPDEPDGVRKR